VCDTDALAVAFRKRQVSETLTLPVGGRETILGLTIGQHGDEGGEQLASNGPPWGLGNSFEYPAHRSKRKSTVGLIFGIGFGTEIQTVPLFGCGGFCFPPPRV